MTTPATKPQRIQLSRAKGWRMPPNTVKVDRTTKWGNPWRIVKRDDGRWWCEGPTGYWQVPTKAAGLIQAIEQHAADAEIHAEHFGFDLILRELRGKNLACWCRLDQPCHADILLKLANPEPTP
ncbi:DUF4326 domain-containing protein [Acidovorax sp. LjRoot118]|uniref:DUF4326 domain-containing protein n=1 Tax=Acidovorax sp. LjRoot118 TaxID=3342256 RepID=UPI003ECE5198